MDSGARRNSGAGPGCRGWSLELFQHTSGKRQAFRGPREPSRSRPFGRATDAQAKCAPGRQLSLDGYLQGLADAFDPVEHRRRLMAGVADFAHIAAARGSTTRKLGDLRGPAMRAFVRPSLLDEVSQYIIRNRYRCERPEHWPCPELARQPNDSTKGRTGRGVNADSGGLAAVRPRPLGQ